MHGKNRPSIPISVIGWIHGCNFDKYYNYDDCICLGKNNEEENETKREKDRIELQRKENEFNDVLLNQLAA